MSSFHVVEASPGDAGILLELIRLSKIAQKCDPSKMSLSEEQLKGDLEAGHIYGFLLRKGEVSVGQMLYRPRYSSSGGPVIHMEELFIKEEHRGHGGGRLLWTSLMEAGKALGSSAIRWQVLAWNEAAIGFYEKMGGFSLTAKSGTVGYRLKGEALAKLGSMDPLPGFEVLVVDPDSKEEMERLWGMMREMGRTIGIPDEAYLHHDLSIRADHIRQALIKAHFLLFQGTTVGYILWGDMYSSWVGRSFWMEDLFVVEEWRGKGIGKAPMAFLAKKAVDEGLDRIQWEAVMGTPAIKVYDHLGANNVNQNPVSVLQFMMKI